MTRLTKPHQAAMRMVNWNTIQNPFRTTTPQQHSALAFCLMGSILFLLLVGAPLSALAEEEAGVVRELPAAVDCQAGETFTVKLTGTPPAGTSSWFVDETPPAGTVVSGVSGGGTYNEDQHRIKWVFLDGSPKQISYDVQVPAGTQNPTELDFAQVDLAESSTWHYLFHPSMDERALIEGDPTTACTPPCPGGPQGMIHPFDEAVDGVFNDDDLFALIDAWRQSAQGELDDLLFAGIDAWKLSPGGYC